MMTVAVSNFICDFVFALLYLRTPEKSSGQTKHWIPGILILFLTFILYPTGIIRLFSNSWVRFFCRALIYLAYLTWMQRKVSLACLYAASFWTTVCTLCHNFFLAPLTYPLFAGTAQFGFSPAVNQLLCVGIIVGTKVICYALICRIVPMEPSEHVAKTRIATLFIITWISLYIKESQIPLMEITASARELSLYIISLQATLLFLLILLEYHQRKMVEHMEVQFQNITTQALLNNIQLKQDSDQTIRHLHHDLKNHMLTLRLFMEKGQHDAALRYIHDFLGQTAPADLKVSTGHTLLDALLREKLSLAQKEHITVNIILDFRKGSFIQDFDLCAIIGNVVDNALEACCQVEPVSDRFIDIHGGVSANCLVVHITNSFAKKPVMIGGLPLTLKSDRSSHGFGLRNVQRLLKKYDGNLTISVEENRFELAMLIPLPEKLSLPAS